MNSTSSGIWPSVSWARNLILFLHHKEKYQTNQVYGTWHIKPDLLFTMKSQTVMWLGYWWDKNSFSLNIMLMGSNRHKVLVLITEIWTRGCSWLICNRHRPARNTWVRKPRHLFFLSEPKWAVANFWLLGFYAPSFFSSHSRTQFRPLCNPLCLYLLNYCDIPDLTP